MYKVAGHVPIAVGSNFNGNYESFFGSDSNKDYFKDLMEIETKNNFKLNKPIIFNEEDELYHETSNTCDICIKTCINKVGDHCHETEVLQVIFVN